MNHFTIFAHGDDFNVDAFLTTTSLDFDKVWHRGDLRGSAEFLQSQHPTSGIEKTLGLGRELSIYDQDRIAIAFLEANEAELTDLAKFPGVSYFILGFHWCVTLTPGMRGFCCSASLRLNEIAARIGLTPTFYIDLDRKDLDVDDSGCTQ